MRTFLLLIFISVFSQANAQNELTINYSEIKEKIENQNSPNYYPTILKRYNNFDKKLTLEEYALLYYGFTFQENYLKNQSEEIELSKLEKEGKYEELISACEKYLLINPVSLKANDLMAYSLYKLNKPESEWRKFQERYRALRKVIVYSGNGLTCETAFKVISVSDEYDVIYTYFDVENIKKQSLVGLCDKFEISPTEYYHSDIIYFDISQKLIRSENLKK
ncbi:DUF4919 domain-containing protein [Sphingobacterium litopenaei]|uniref:DUF4919 domain-containing protein n=1 Tax=Sphingobacterium litopenaei TaxID=2763500 RepID=A0ABR7YCB8_9SPHI|nr:DUF4919 domain-containing protein [Sphingobacterium litopenaei]MBD1428955.1 DUF4919 domain-containing protein [Sphingobacterium litopenaei]